MLKLYRKSELGFALACIAVYVLVFGNLRSLGDDSPWMALCLLAYAALLFVFVKKNGLAEEYGLAGWAKNSRQMLWFIPLWILATGNLWGGIQPKYAGFGLVCAVVMFALVGFVEELIFRGFLFRAMLRGGRAATAIVVSSVTFGMGHIVNLLSGHGDAETLLQVVFAIAMGFIFTMVYYKSGSLLPGILAHCLIDVFSVFSIRSGLGDWIFFALVPVTAVAYGLWLRRVETPPVNRIGKAEKES